MEAHEIEERQWTASTQTPQSVGLRQKRPLRKRTVLMIAILLAFIFGASLLQFVILAG